MLEDGHDGIISYVDCHTASFLESLSSLHAVPLIIAVPEPCQLETLSDFSLKLWSPQDDLLLLIADVVKTLGWADISVIYDTYESE